jgi:hypothetical protein
MYSALAGQRYELRPAIRLSGWPSAIQIPPGKFSRLLNLLQADLVQPKTCWDDAYVEQKFSIDV